MEAMNHEVTDENLGQALLAECKRRGISQSEAARGFGVHRQAFSDWVNGKRTPAKSYAPELARFLRVPVKTVRAMLTRPRGDRITILEERVTSLEDALRTLERLLAQPTRRAR
jgi:transcriptional regulator with XRE-family HTH domain